MRIKKIEFKNFQSYGNIVQEINFENTDQGLLYLLSGHNGSGKSSISNVIKWLLYGKVDGFNNTDLPNRINKELWGKIEIESKSKSIVIERGINPNIFNIFIDGQPYDQAGKLNTQDYLENEIYEINFNVFKNLLVLSINDFKSFLTMNPGDKKAIIDRIFGFSILNDMKEYVKQKRKDLKIEIKSIDDEILNIKESMESIKNRISKLESNEREKRLENISKFNETLLKYTEEYKKYLGIKVEASKKLTEIQNRISNKTTDLLSFKNQIEFYLQKINLYNSDKCPECEGDLHSDFHRGKKDEYEALKREAEISAINVGAEMKELRERGKLINEGYQKTIEKIAKTEEVINQLKNNLKTLSESEKRDDLKEFDSLIKEFRRKANDKSKVKIEKQTDDYNYQLLENILSEDGVKNAAANLILPMLNLNIAMMCNKMHIPFQIKFDTKFDAIITHLGENVNAKTLSSGERKKADFAVIIALIKMLKLRYPTINLLFLDEIFSSVDADGIYHILEILSESIKEIDLNIFVVNHTPLPSELFDKRIEVVKDAGFSKIIIEDLN